MKRRVISMLAAVALLATASAPGAFVYAEGDVDMTVSTGGMLQNKGDGESGTLDDILNSNASIMGALGNTSWTVRAESVQKTGKWRDDMIAVAQSQLGYTQDAAGMTIYGEWMELTDPIAWDAQFISWVADKAGLTEKQFPHGASYDELVEKLSKVGAVKEITRSNYPNTGDIALLEIAGEKRMGVVAYISGGYAAVICGNDAGAVTRATYQIDGKEFKSYADMNVLMSRAGLTVSKGDEVIIPEGGVAGHTNTDSVYMRKEPTTKSKKVTMVKKSGTALLVTSAEKQEDGYVWYGVTYKEYTGYIRGDLVKLDAIEQPAATTAPETAPACVVCGANGEKNACLYAELAAKTADEAFAFLQNLLESDRAAFDLYVKCHNAHVAAGAPAVICGNGCEQPLTNLVAPGATHSESCPWHAEAQLGVEERVVNIEVIQVENGQKVNITFEVYGATKYEWHEVETSITGESDSVIGNTNEDQSVLTVTAKSTDKRVYSYYCVATIADGSTVTSKITKVDVATAPIVADAILGEEVKFTYTVEGAASYQWYVDGTAIAADDLTYSGANTNMLGFYATEEKATKTFVCAALDANGNVLYYSAQYKFNVTVFEISDVTTCEGHDLCKYVEELANMTPAERNVAMEQTWNIQYGDGILKDYVQQHWEACHKNTYPTLLDFTTTDQGTTQRPTQENGMDFSVFASSCEEFAKLFPAEHALIESWAANSVSPLTMYDDMQALKEAPGYTAEGKKYDRYNAVLMHLGSCKVKGLSNIICQCGHLTMGDKPGSDHVATCPWHVEQGMSNIYDQKTGEQVGFWMILKDNDGNLVEVGEARPHPLDPTPGRYYIKDKASGLYVAYYENGKIYPLASMK